MYAPSGVPYHDPLEDGFAEFLEEEEFIEEEALEAFEALIEGELEDEKTVLKEVEGV